MLRIDFDFWINQSMDLSIIILNYKNVNLVREQLRVLTAYQFPFLVEIIVVDNASGDDLKVLEREYPSLRVYALPHNLGMGAGNNRGIGMSHGSDILILNPDIVVSCDAVVALRRYLEAYPTAGMVGPKLLNPDATLQETCFRFPKWYTPLFRRTKFSLLPWGKWELDRFLMRDWDHASARNVDWLLGGAIMVRRKAIAEVGMFDERFFLFFEETDWCRRFWQKGWEVAYVPQAVMFHYPNRLSSGTGFMVFFSRMAWIHIASWVKYLWKWRGYKFESRSMKSEIPFAI